MLARYVADGNQKWLEDAEIVLNKERADSG